MEICWDHWYFRTRLIHSKDYFSNNMNVISVLCMHSGSFREHYLPRIVFSNQSPNSSGRTPSRI